MRINLTDNRDGLKSGELYSRENISALFPISDKTVKQLCDENENLLIFPHSIDSANDKVGDLPVLSILNSADPDMVSISTGNVMGFIGVGDVQVNIKSRFDEGRADFFLHYMLQKVLSFNLFDLNHNSEHDDVFDFVMFMFPYLLKNAMRQGIYREYRNFQHNSPNVKGTIDINRHIARNLPFTGNIAFNTLEYSYDNSITELIRHTIEYMRTTTYGEAILGIDRETIDYIKSIVEHTPSYNKNDRSSVISKNLRSKRHPYYTEYIPLQKLCLQILRMEDSKYGECDDEMCGILFDGAWLWEEYLNVILSKLGYIHPENKHQKGAIYLFDNHSGVRYPDFYKEGVVLDAKYKRIGDLTNVSKVDRDDVHQVISYMTVQQAFIGGFIAPLLKRQEFVPTSKLRGTGASLSIFGVEVSKCSTSYKDFCKEMEKNEKLFIDNLVTKIESYRNHKI